MLQAFLQLESQEGLKLVESSGRTPLHRNELESQEGLKRNYIHPRQYGNSAEFARISRRVETNIHRVGFPKRSNDLESQEGLKPSRRGLQPQAGRKLFMLESQEGLKRRTTNLQAAEQLLVLSRISRRVETTLTRGACLHQGQHS